MQKLEEKLSESEKENDYLKRLREYWHDLFDEAISDCIARMKGLGISEKTIKEYNAYWQSVQFSRPLYVKKIYESDDKIKIQELEQEIDRLKKKHKKVVDALDCKIAWQAKGIAELTQANYRLKDLLDEKKGTSLW